MDMIRQGSPTSLFEGFAAMGEDVVIGGKTPFDSQLSGTNCQTFSTGSNYGARGGSGSRRALCTRRQSSVTDARNCLIVIPYQFDFSVVAGWGGVGGPG
jgi:hypothetical protein